VRGSELLIASMLVEICSYNDAKFEIPHLRKKVGKNVKLTMTEPLSTLNCYYL